MLHFRGKFTLQMNHPLQVDEKIFKELITGTFYQCIESFLYRYLRLSSAEVKDLFPVIVQTFFELANTNQAVLIKAEQNLKTVATRIAIDYIKNYRNFDNALAGRCF